MITILRRLYKYVLLLILLNILLPGTGFLLNAFLGINLSWKDIISLSSLFTLITIITITIFLRGQPREPDSQTLHSLVAISLKFLLDMILALVWFFIAKKTYAPSVLMFFVIYLTFTIFSIFVILKILTNSSLQYLH